MGIGCNTIAQVDGFKYTVCSRGIIIVMNRYATWKIKTELKRQGKE